MKHEITVEGRKGLGEKRREVEGRGSASSYFAI